MRVWSQEMVEVELVLGRTSARARFLPLRASCWPRPAPGCRTFTPIVAAASSTVTVPIRHHAAQLLQRSNSQFISLCLWQLSTS